ncbi:MAG: glycosyltransferase family 2 protein [Clostridia bacterium]|nr:glycosyltransferase family 2 protein [Clostridia bacterium]
MEETISVVVSVYKVKDYLDHCVRTLLEQTYRNYEILLVDDGSPDECGAMCDAWAKKETRIRAYHKPNGGLSSARNFGITHAKGAFIIFPDPDDWVEPQYLEKLMSIREANHADLSICGNYNFKSGKEYIWNSAAVPMILNTAEALEMMMRPSAFRGFAWNKLYSMKVINDHALRFDEELGMAQDLHFNVRYLQLCRRIAYDPVPLYHYNRDSSGVTVVKNTLTPRQMSGLQTYKKIAEMTHAVYPAVEETAYASLCRLCLQYIKAYCGNGMKDRAILSVLQKDFLRYKRYFRSSSAYGTYEKRFSWLVAVHPKLYEKVYNQYSQYIHRKEKR